MISKNSGEQAKSSIFLRILEKACDFIKFSENSRKILENF